MKTLSNLKPDVTEAADLAHSAKPAAHTQSSRVFTRRLWISQTLITAENSTGGKIQIPVAELWKMIEGADATFVPPSAPA